MTRTRGTITRMDDVVQRVIDRVTEAAARHDATQENRLDRWRVLEPDAGRFLWFLAQTVGARNIVEIGTSRGVSTLWLADAARASGGRVISYDTDPDAQRDAARTIEEAGLQAFVELRLGDGGEGLATLGDGAVDLLFLDSERPEYPSWWPHPVRVLRSGGVLVADNALSHPDEIAPLHDLLLSDLTAVTTIPVGKGELVALRG
ncbi:O-methyltransferase [Actinophytocola sp.]|uniref:O-methyltransferase n=1 Tax=Actinophytocola sp. TaxID=1872138 RepID=UPI00389A1742